MAKIMQTRRRGFIASSIAFVLMATMMMPATTHARGGGGGGHGGVGTRNIGVLGLAQPRFTPSPGISVVRRFAFSPRHAFPRRQFAFHHSHAIGSHFFALGADGAWVDTFTYSPTIVIAQQSPIAQEQPGPRHAAVVRTPGAAQQGIIVVRGDSKSYVTFGKPG
ncbi:MAG TPA: hypothetical protein VGF92_18725 [Stellaceae bacterium]